MRFLFLILFLSITPLAAGGIAVEKMKQLPVQQAGRIKPLDTVARSCLLMLHGSQSIEGSSAIEWMVELIMGDERAMKRALIRIENSDLLVLLGKEPKARTYYSIEELQPYFQEIQENAARAFKLKTSERTPFERAAAALWEQIAIFLSLRQTLWLSDHPLALEELDLLKRALEQRHHTLSFFEKRFNYQRDIAYFSPLYPLNIEQSWQTMGEGLLAKIEGEPLHPAVETVARLLDSYSRGDAATFNERLDPHLSEFAQRFPKARAKVFFELLYNTAEPFFWSALLYLLAILLSALSWVVWERSLQRIVLMIFVCAFVLHTFGLLGRMIIEGRPPVTNLYSSALFVGWGAAFFSLFIERLFRCGFGLLVGATVACATLVVAHHLTGAGDTMEALRAVLDSNFWLSTHVVTISLGYSATLLAGSIAAFFILFAPTLSKTRADSLTKMVYGTVCFALLLSFVGTILGGIWADQAWGRFWGWDPKENGALMIILWNAAILHARWGGLIGGRGLMLMAVGGNIMTSFSWFGVNMLGVGLHSYGFMDGAFMALGAFILLHILLIGVGAITLSNRT